MLSIVEATAADVTVCFHIYSSKQKWRYRA
jgi:hypothetical protein